VIASTQGLVQWYARKDQGSVDHHGKADEDVQVERCFSYDDEEQASMNTVSCHAHHHGQYQVQVSIETLQKRVILTVSFTLMSSHE